MEWLRKASRASLPTLALLLRDILSVSCQICLAVSCSAASAFAALPQCTWLHFLTLLTLTTIPIAIHVNRLQFSP